MDLTSLDDLEPEAIVHPLILYVGDDEAVFKHLLKRLLSGGFLVRAVETTTAVWRTIVQVSPFAVLIDATHASARWRPWQLCRNLSECHRFPVVMVFDRETDSAERAMALEQGADRCFRLGPSFYDELAAYMDAKTSRPSVPVAVSQRGDSREARVKIIWETRQVMRNNRVLSLSPKEFALLQLLKHHFGRVVSQREIVRALWKRSYCPSAHANLKQVIKHLRSKIEVDPQHPKFLVNVRGIGYRLQIDLMDESDGHDS